MIAARLRAPQLVSLKPAESDRRRRAGGLLAARAGACGARARELQLVALEELHPRFRSPNTQFPPGNLPYPLTLVPRGRRAAVTGAWLARRPRQVVKAQTLLHLPPRRLQQWRRRRAEPPAHARNGEHAECGLRSSKRFPSSPQREWRQRRGRSRCLLLLLSWRLLSLCHRGARSSARLLVRRRAPTHAAPTHALAGAKVNRGRQSVLRRVRF